jgi:hypothetical protein
MVRACLMMEKTMTRGMELDEVNGDKLNLATAILDDANLEVVSGGAYHLGLRVMFGLGHGALNGVSALGHERLHSSVSSLG